MAEDVQGAQVAVYKDVQIESKKNEDLFVINPHFNVKSYIFI